jgi:hypothetical protein
MSAASHRFLSSILQTVTIRFRRNDDDASVVSAPETLVALIIAARGRVVQTICPGRSLTESIERETSRTIEKIELPSDSPAYPGPSSEQ